ncbi:mucin-2-like [Ostrea edulis]|uniref:mucin-2-like n=1 Tax=Ostrea edulis TaxID=37623 RepID=UPI00209469BD|nr:mucin-2-like [Ostrea edulis]XP_048771276.1 mucin-2-like [Ostrea edulis]XP_048771277.1 mucin-2-like [Ostrea edulis]
MTLGSVLVILVNFWTVSYVSTTHCDVVDTVDNQWVNVDSLRTDKDPRYLSESAASSKEDCQQACCQTDKCSVVVFDSTQNQSNTNCFLLACTQEQECIFEDKDGTVTYAIDKKHEVSAESNTNTKSVTAAPPTPPSITEKPTATFASKTTTTAALKRTTFAPKRTTTTVAPKTTTTAAPKTTTFASKTTTTVAPKTTTTVAPRTTTTTTKTTQSPTAAPVLSSMKRPSTTSTSPSTSKESPLTPPPPPPPTTKTKPTNSSTATTAPTTKSIATNATSNQLLNTTSTRTTVSVVMTKSPNGTTVSSTSQGSRPMISSGTTTTNSSDVTVHSDSIASNVTTAESLTNKETSQLLNTTLPELHDSLLNSTVAQIKPPPISTQPFISVQLSPSSSSLSPLSTTKSSKTTQRPQSSLLSTKGPSNNASMSVTRETISTTLPTEAFNANITNTSADLNTTKNTFIGRLDKADQQEPSNAMIGGLIALFCFGTIFLLAIVVIFSKKLFEVWQRRHYSRIDYLVNGMYN